LKGRHRPLSLVLTPKNLPTPKEKGKLDNKVGKIMDGDLSQPKVLEKFLNESKVKQPATYALHAYPCFILRLETESFFYFRTDRFL